MAAGDGYESVVRHLLELGATVDLPNRHGATALSHAAVRGHAKVIEVLLAAGADPNGGPRGGGTVMHALFHGSNIRGKRLASVMRALLAAGVLPVDAADEKGVTALMLAADSGEMEACRILLENGADGALTTTASGLNAVMRAAAKGQAATLKLLLESGVDADAKAGPKLHSATALYLAAQNGHTKAVKALLTSGASVDPQVDQVLATPLFAAAEQGHIDCVKLLLEYNANPASVNWNRVSVLHMAAIRGNVEVMDVLVQRHGGGDTIVKEDPLGLDGTSALISVAASDATRDEGLPPDKRSNTIKWLLTHGMDMYIRREVDGYTALLAAAAAGMRTC